ncbi:MAG: ATP-binding protein [Gammaproteobacteria bacterium]|nr:ATP-binding protein [Gammaproteobacteria bacterium]
MGGDTDKLFKRLDELLDRLELIMPADKAREQDWSFQAYRWIDRHLQGIPDYHQVDPRELLHIERQAGLLTTNTRQFLQGHAANNALLWGARGTGKSSIIKAQLHEFKDQGLCLVEVNKQQSENLFDIIGTLSLDQRKYIIYMDDLSFEGDDESYKALKATLEGSLQAQPANVLIYATSNRRHLMPESMQDNLDSSMVDGQLHPSDAIEEKISLSDRFGLWLSFHPFTQRQYLDVVELALQRFDLAMDKEVSTQAIRFATQRGSRSGRIANQFATYWYGQTLDK